MTRSAALRAAALFILVALVAAGLGLGSQAVAAEAMFLIAASLAAVTLTFVLIAPDAHVLRPVRISRQRPYR
jgi:hypothetical protein